MVKKSWTLKGLPWKHLCPASGTMKGIQVQELLTFTATPTTEKDVDSAKDIA
jgi:hypothetical protein